MRNSSSSRPGQGPNRSSVRVWLVSGLTVALGLIGAPAAVAGVTQSTNWAGYAVHRSGVAFEEVQGTWREPRAKCIPGHPTYSSYWVGIGGYSLSSRALEQVGTEVDCSSAGSMRTSAWYELVPAPSVPVRLNVPPGDLIRAKVTVKDKVVRVSLLDVTAHRGFSRVLRARTLDLSSAEWIVEAPSDCLSTNTCITLPLGDFGSATFTGASARSVSGRAGAISDHVWRASQIDLVPHGRGSARGGAATTSGLRGGGSTFTVSYLPLETGAAAPITGRAAGAATTSLAPGQLWHPARARPANAGRSLIRPPG